MATAPSDVLMQPGKKKLKGAGGTVTAIQPSTVDPLQSLAGCVETLSQDSALATIPELMNASDENYIRLGGVLSVVARNDWWKSSGSESFKAYLEKEVGLHYRKAMYLIQIYDDLIESQVAWAKVAVLGWTKLKELSPILTVDNVDEWVEKAKGLTALQIAELVKAAKAAPPSLTAGVEVPAEDPAKVTTLTFKVHPDQKESIKMAVEKAKAELKTEFDAVAIEAICMNYLSGGKVSKKAKPVEIDLPATLKQLGPEKAMELIGSVFPELDITVSMP